jgi:hypothetical protein
MFSYLADAMLLVCRYSISVCDGIRLVWHFAQEFHLILPLALADDAVVGGRRIVRFSELASAS